MDNALPPSPDLAQQIHHLLNAQALNQVPRVLSELMRGEHCVIWKPSRKLAAVKTAGDGIIGRLYPYSSDFPQGDGIQHAGIPLDIDADTTGRFYRSRQKSDLDNDFAAKDERSLGAKFMVEKEGLKKVCLARFAMPEKDGSDFMVSVYRKTQQEDFTADDAHRLEVLAGFLPFLYQKLISAQLREAVGRANEILRPRCVKVEDAKEPLNRLSKLLADYFNIKEVSVFLKDTSAGSEQFDCFASTVMEQLARHSYKASKHDGLTGYVLTNQATIWFHDLHNFRNPEVMKVIQHRHPGICCTDGARFAKLARAMFKLPKDAHPPPLSLLVVPIPGEHDTMFGALRASLGVNPFHFLDEQIKVFEIIASEIGRWWESIIHNVQQERRGDVWKAANNSMLAQQKYLRGSDDMNGLCQTVVASIVEQPGFDLACFRRGKDREKLELSALKYGPAERERRNKPGSKGNPVKGTIIPLAVRLDTPDLVRGFSVPHIERSSREMSLLCSQEEVFLFGSVARVLSFPVFIRAVLYGVLDIGFHDDRDYLPAAERIKEYGAILARQLALFERITESIDEVEKAQSNEINTYATVTHQLKTPLFTASRRLLGLASRSPGVWTSEDVKALWKISGMVRKARSVTSMIETLGRIVARQPIKVMRLMKAHPQNAWKLCLEVAQNAQVSVDERMRIYFALKPDAWGYAPEFRWDYEFAEQCLDAVISNAFKYSAPTSRIAIQGHPEGMGYAIRVTNIGDYCITESEAALCTQPYWRGNKAREREGAGIGLWIASELMKAQGGELKVYPTNLDTRETTIELRFV